MSTRFSKNTTPSSSDRKNGFPFTRTDASRRSDPKPMGCGTAVDRLTGPLGNQLKTSRAKSLFLCAVLAFLPAVLVATWYQFRVVGGLESQATVGEAFNLAARMDAVVAARASAIRMAAGSLEIENLTASGGLNRLLSTLKELFPDFRSLEVFNEQGRPLAMMGELSLADIGKQSGLLRATNHDSGVSAESMFHDAPADGSFFLTLRHQGAEAVVWFSRVRFSREAITSALLPHRGGRDVRLVFTPLKGATTEESAPGQRASEPGDQSAFNWRERTYLANAPLAVGGWVVSLKRTVPVSPVLYLALALGAILVLVAGILCFRSASSAQPRDEAVDEPAVQELPAVPPTQDVEALLPCDEPSEQAAPAQKPIADAAACAEVDQHSEDTDEFGPAVAWSSWKTDEEAAPGSVPFVQSELPSDPPHGPEGAFQAEEFAPEPDGGKLTWEPEVDEFGDGPDFVLSEPGKPGSDQPMGFIDKEYEESVIVGEPILQDAIPDTLEVSWTEPLSEEAPAPEERSTIKIISPWS